MNKYNVECSFIHYDSNEKLYRVKVSYPSGGAVYQVMNGQQLRNLNIKEGE